MKKNAVVHFEIYGENPDQLAKFYSSLFDWSVEPVPGMSYAMIKTADTDAAGMPSKPGAINGGMVTQAMPGMRGWINYVSVDSVDAAVERAQKLGAKLMKGKMPVPGMGWFAMLADPQGNPFAVWQEDSKAA